MANENCLKDIRCPKCWQDHDFDLSARAWFGVSDEGTDEFHSVEWEDDSAIVCAVCKHVGIVADFTEPTLESVADRLGPLILELRNVFDRDDLATLLEEEVYDRLRHAQYSAEADQEEKGEAEEKEDEHVPAVVCSAKNLVSVEAEDLKDGYRHRYIDSGGICCPYCGDQDMVGGNIDIDEHNARQPMSCSGCTREWVDVYTLVDIEEVRCDNSLSAGSD